MNRSHFLKETAEQILLRYQVIAMTAQLLSYAIWVTYAETTWKPPPPPLLLFWKTVPPSIGRKRKLALLMLTVTKRLYSLLSIIDKFCRFSNAPQIHFPKLIASTLHSYLPFPGTLPFQSEFCYQLKCYSRFIVLSYNSLAITVV